MVLEFYNDQTILITGGGGLVGTAIIYKLITTSKPAKIYVLIRGSQERIWTQWRTVLPEAAYSTLRNSPLLTILVGDASVPKTLGLPADTLSTLANSVTIVINLASKIRLLDSLSKIKTTNIDPALNVAEVATTFPHLIRFIWTSSAYANAHLHWKDPKETITEVGEDVYSVGADEDADKELAEIESQGSSSLYKTHFFSSEYGYAKHLTERLLLSRFRKPGAERLPHLLIVRPSCIGPALREPAPGYEIMGSTPITTLMSYTIYRSAKVSGAYALPTRNNSGFGTLVNECPVDLVANRIIAHTAKGTLGIVHAVVSGKEQLVLGDYWKEYISTVPYALQPGVEWVDDTTLLKQFQAPSTARDSFFDIQFGPVSRGFAFLGASYNFADSKTESLWADMSAEEKAKLPLMVDGRDELACALKTRKKRSAADIASQLSKSGFFSALEGGSGIFDGHFDSGFLTRPIGTGVQLATDTAGAVVGGTQQVVGGILDSTVGQLRSPHSGGSKDSGSGQGGLLGGGLFGKRKSGGGSGFGL